MFATCEVSGQLQQNVIVQLSLCETYGSMSARQISSQTGQSPHLRTVVHLRDNYSVLIILHDIFKNVYVAFDEKIVHLLSHL